MQEAFNAKAQRRKDAARRSRNRSGARPAPRAQRLRMKQGGWLSPASHGDRSRCGRGPPARRRFRRFFAACEQTRPWQGIGDATRLELFPRLRVGKPALPARGLPLPFQFRSSGCDGLAGGGPESLRLGKPDRQSRSQTGAPGPRIVSTVRCMRRGSRQGFGAVEAPGGGGGGGPSNSCTNASICLAWKGLASTRDAPHPSAIPR